MGAKVKKYYFFIIIFICFKWDLTKYLYYIFIKILIFEFLNWTYIVNNK
jgi:hypothetical protein